MIATAVCVRALLFCSHEGCDAVYEALGELAEIETLACDCGCGLAVVGFAEPAPEAGPGPALEPV
jgi:hypothetical protein